MMKSFQAVACLSVVLAYSVAFAASPPASTTLLNDVTLDEAKLRVHFIDIGAGLAILIETPGDRKHVFVDGGDQGRDKMEDYLEKFVGDDPINVYIVTHADHDHFRNFSLMDEDYAVEEFWYTGYESTELGNLARWPVFLAELQANPNIEFYSPLGDFADVGFLELLDDGGTPGDSSDDIVVQYLNVDKQPPDRDPNSNRSFSESERRNNASFVFKLIYNDVSFLITGDINGRRKEHVGRGFDDEIDSEEFELLDRHLSDGDKFGLRATVLQAPHHGANGSNSLKFLQAVDPEWIVISAGHKHDHPKVDTLRRMKRAGVATDHILRTDHGDPTPESDPGTHDGAGDDSYIFETDGLTITRILRVNAP